VAELHQRGRADDLLELAAVSDPDAETAPSAARQLFVGVVVAFPFGPQRAFERLAFLRAIGADLLDALFDEAIEVVVKRLRRVERDAIGVRALCDLTRVRICPRT